MQVVLNQSLSVLKLHYGNFQLGSFHFCRFALLSSFAYNPVFHQDFRTFHHHPFTFSFTILNFTYFLLNIWLTEMFLFFLLFSAVLFLLLSHQYFSVSVLVSILQFTLCYKCISEHATFLYKCSGTLGKFLSFLLLLINLILKNTKIK